MAVVKAIVAKKRATPVWTRTREIMFLEHLAISCNVAASERVADVLPGSAYSHRRRRPEFFRAWQRALKEGYATLELSMLDRALNGVPVERVTRDGIVTKTREYSDRLAAILYAAHRGTIAKLIAIDDAVGAKAELERMIATMAKRAGDE